MFVLSASEFVLNTAQHDFSEHDPHVCDIANQLPLSYLCVSLEVGLFTLETCAAGMQHAHRPVAAAVCVSPGTLGSPIAKRAAGGKLRRVLKGALRTALSGHTNSLHG